MVYESPRTTVSMDSWQLSKWYTVLPRAKLFTSFNTGDRIHTLIVLLTPLTPLPTYAREGFEQEMNSIADRHCNDGSHDERNNTLSPLRPG